VYYVPEFDGGLIHWVLLSFLIIGPILMVSEATGWMNFGYSKFADPDKRWSISTRTGMLIVYVPAVLLVWIPLLVTNVQITGWHLLVCSLVSGHFAKRCVETLTLHRYSAVMNFDAIVAICGLYSGISLVLGVVAATEVGGGGMPTTGFEPWVAVGLAVWFFGLGLNLYHHLLLSKLRRSGELDYTLPRGGLFRWAACPHYLGEILGWWGFSLVFHHVAGLIITIAMACYLAGRAHGTLQWYRQRFGDQVPAHWKRMVPFVY
jgi:steroid 5-alpha reductase family enzyme